MAFNAIIPNDPVEIKTAYRPTISMKKELTILLLGSGGREHALAWKIAQSPKCGKLYIAPGNAGTREVGENVPIGVNDFEALKAFAADNSVDMVVVGPEDPLVRGIYDDFRSDQRTCHIPVIGPSKAGAVLEGSKDFAKAFMKRHNIPTARYETFDGEHVEEGIAFLETLHYMLYELIHTRSLHCCIKALPGVLYLLAFCVIFSGAVWYGKQFAENDYARPEQVNSISLTYQPVFYYAYSGEDDYYCCEMRDYEITDREVIGILCEALNKEMRHEGHDEVCEGVRLVINGGVFFSHRDVSVEQSDMERIFNILGKDESYRDIFLKPVDRELVASIESSENRDSRNGSVEETDILYKVYCDVVADYEKEEFAKIVHRITRPQIGGENLLTMRLKDGRKMVVYQQESDENAESDAFMEAFMDLRTTEGEQELVKLAFPEVEDTPNETLAIVRVDFCNMTPHFTEGGKIDEISAIKLSDHIWSTDMALTPTGWDRLKHSGSEEFYEEYINELYQRIYDGSNWEVTDSSLPYIQVRYIVIQYVEGEEEARMLKEVNSSYRLNPEVLRWLGAQ